MTIDHASEPDTEPVSCCSTVHVVIADMGNGVVRITHSRRADIAEAKAFMAKEGVLTIGSSDLERGRWLAAAAFTMAGLAPPSAYVCAVRAIDDGREAYLWTL